MSDNKHNIDEIQAYLGGKLDAKAMHRLEREAQDDPFLMDAMEGYQNSGKNQLENFTDVKARFAERTGKKKERSIILWRILPIAATLLIVLGIGFLWLSPKEDAKLQFNKSVSLPKQTVDKTTTAINLSTKPENNTKQIVAALPTRSAKSRVINHDVAAFNHSKHKRFNTGQDKPQAVNPDLAAVLANRAQSLDITPNSTTQTQSSEVITGKVTDATGHALAGVKVFIKETDIKVVTDTNGVFNITSAVTHPTLNLAYAGYDSKKVAVTGKDNLNIVLNESTNELAQVSVAGYSDTSNLGIHPAAGWKAFKDYIKKNAFMPDGETGRVKLAFTVNAQGAIKGIRIVRGKNNAMNQKAIALLMNGPQWMGSTDAKELKLKIRFRRMKTT